MVTRPCHSPVIFLPPCYRKVRNPHLNAAPSSMSSSFMPKSGPPAAHALPKLKASKSKQSLSSPKSPSPQSPPSAGGPAHKGYHPMFGDITMKKIFSSKPRKPHHPRGGPTKGLEQTKFILGFLSSLGDGGACVPGLKSATSLAIQIIDTAHVSEQSSPPSSVPCLVPDRHTRIRDLHLLLASRNEQGRM